MCIFEEKPEETTLEQLVDWEYTVCYYVGVCTWSSDLHN